MLVLQLKAKHPHLLRCTAQRGLASGLSPRTWNPCSLERIGNVLPTGIWGNRILGLEEKVEHLKDLSPLQENMRVCEEQKRLHVEYVPHWTESRGLWERCSERQPSAGTHGACVDRVTAWLPRSRTASWQCRVVITGQSGGERVIICDLLNTEKQERFLQGGAARLYVGSSVPFRSLLRVGFLMD